MRVSLRLGTFLAAVLWAAAAWAQIGTGQVIATLGEEERVNSLAFSPDGKSLVAACGRFVALLQEPRPGKVLIWDIATRTVRATLDGHGDGVSCAMFSATGKMLATGGYDGPIKFWNPETGKGLEGLDAKIGPVMAMAFSADSSRLVAGGWGGAEKCEFAVWNVPNRKPLATVPAHEQAVNAVLFLADDRAIVTGSTDGIVKLWDANNFQELRTLAGHAGGVQCMALSPDGKILAVASGDLFSVEDPKKPSGGLRLWSAASWQQLLDLPLPEVVFSVAFSPDGQLLAVAGTDQAIRLLDTSGREQSALRGHADTVRSVCFSPDGKTLASGGSDGTIKLWRLPTGNEHPQ